MRVPALRRRAARRRAPSPRTCAARMLLRSPGWMRWRGERRLRQAGEPAGHRLVQGPWRLQCACWRWTPAERARGVVAYSTGNHGQAIAWASAPPGRAGHHRDAGGCAKEQGGARHRAGRAGRATTTARSESREDIGMRLLAETGAHTGSRRATTPMCWRRKARVALEALARPAARRARKPGPVRRALRRGRPDGRLLPGARGAGAAGRGAWRWSPASFDDTVRSPGDRGRARDQSPGAQHPLRRPAGRDACVNCPIAINQPLPRPGRVSRPTTRSRMRCASRWKSCTWSSNPAAASRSPRPRRPPVARRPQSAVIVLSGGNVDLPLLQVR